LKPTNILFKNGIIKLADFDDIAFHHFEDQTHTDEKGTFNFRAPEVSEYGKKYDTRADIYSLGIVFKKLFNLDIYRYF
jgi:serine/threonine protein kinase